MSRILTDLNKTTTGSAFFRIIVAGLFLMLMSLTALPVYGQFEAAEFEKVTKQNRPPFERLLQDISLTGQGLYENTKLDERQTNEIRARLQAAFGEPTQKLEDLINQDDFRLGKAIQFEYWFTVNDSIPLVILDLNGPFGRGLTFGGASKYIDLMPQIKREFAQKLMAVEEYGEYEDYFYSPEKEKWYIVRYKDGKFRTEEIDSPPGMSID